MEEKYSIVMQLGRHSNVVLLRELSSGNLVVRRIASTKQAEIYQILDNIMNPHIPAIYSISALEDGQYEILEEYVNGYTLEEILLKEVRLPETSAADYMTQLCDVLEHIHKAGIVHRDIKPGNIIITPDGHLYLIDFDIARTHKNERDYDTEILGTQGYAAPEQFGFHQTDAQADIYSAGILLNKLLTGKMPHEYLPKGSAEYVVRRCIQMDTARRYRNARALRKALRPFLPKGHPQAFHFLRQIPGFRSFSRWKMITAITVYAAILLSLLVGLPELYTAGPAVHVLMSVYSLYYLLLFFFIFDVFQIRSRIPWLEKSRGRWRYPLKCILFPFVVLIAVSIVIAFIPGM